MEDKRATIKDKVSPDLLVSPHIVSELLHVVMGEWQPDSSQQQQLVVHLTECEHCRTALIVLLSADQEYEMATTSSAETPARNLLTQFVTIHHEIAVQDFEKMGAYTETIKAVGRKEADKRFPVLAEHIRKCSSCKAWLEETLAFLNESEEND